MAKSTRQLSLAGFAEPETAAGESVSNAMQSADVARSGDQPRSGGVQTTEVQFHDADAAMLPEDLRGRVVYVVDSHSLIYQVFHVMPDMTSPTGQPVGAVYGFIRDVLDIIQKKRPDYLFCAFDYPIEITFRHSLYEQYKAHREAMPEDLRPQIANIQRMLTAMGVPVLQLQNYEADDILATLARLTDERGGTCYLVTSDKDCRQLITDRVQLFNIRKGEFFDATTLQADWGIRPDQVVDFQALVGDSVDNVPGVPLIGPKLARELLTKYETLDSVLDHAGEVSGTKRKENLIKYRDQALLSRDLVRLVNDVPLEIDWRAGRVGGMQPALLAELCREFGFRKLAEQLGQAAGSEGQRSVAAGSAKEAVIETEMLTDPAQLADETTAAAEPESPWDANYRTIATPHELVRLVEQMAQQRRISIDTETTSTNPRWAELVGMSFAWQAGAAFYVPLRSPPGEPCLELQPALHALRPVLEDPTIAKIGQNLKYDMVVLRSAGIHLQGVALDTMVADYLLDPGERNHSLGDLSKRHLRHTMIPIHDLIGSGKKQKSMADVPVAKVTEYAAEDADVAWRLAAILDRNLVAEELDKLFRDLEMPLIEVLSELEFNGVKVDVTRLAELSQRYGEQMQKLETEIYQLAGETFNIDSPQQLGRILFDKLKLPVLKKTQQKSTSTDVEVLSQLARLHPLPAKIIDYRQNGKLKSTYVDALPQLVNPRTGRVHTSFKQDVAATGRLSSTEPNLQNIPIRTAEGRDIRSAFLAGEPGWLLLKADYSQIELRVLAHFSGDAALRQAFAEDRDIHTQVAAEVYGVPLDQVTPEMRRGAKAVNFGVIYGQSAFGLAKALDIEKAQAAAFIEAYFARYPGVEAFMRKVLEDCRAKGYVTTILGRRRAVQGVRDPSRVGDSRQRTLPERIAINTVIQGSAADLIKQAMINLHRRLRRESWRARMLLQIHDELVLEVPAAERDELATVVATEMIHAYPLSVPLKVDVQAGPNWAACEALQ